MNPRSLTKLFNYCFLVFYSLDLFSWIIDVGPVHPFVFLFCALVVSAFGLISWREWGRRMMVKLSVLGGLFLVIDMLLVSRVCDWVTLNMAVNFMACFFLYRSRFVQKFYQQTSGKI